MPFPNNNRQNYRMRPNNTPPPVKNPYLSHQELKKKAQEYKVTQLSSQGDNQSNSGTRRQVSPEENKEDLSFTIPGNETELPRRNIDSNTSDMPLRRRDSMIIRDNDSMLIRDINKAAPTNNNGFIQNSNSGRISNDANRMPMNNDWAAPSTRSWMDSMDNTMSAIAPYEESEESLTPKSNPYDNNRSFPWMNPRGDERLSPSTSRDLSNRPPWLMYSDYDDRNRMNMENQDQMNMNDQNLMDMSERNQRNLDERDRMDMNDRNRMDMNERNRMDMNERNRMDMNERNRMNMNDQNRMDMNERNRMNMNDQNRMDMNERNRMNMNDQNRMDMNERNRMNMNDQNRMDMNERNRMNMNDQNRMDMNERNRMNMNDQNRMDMNERNRMNMQDQNRMNMNERNRMDMNEQNRMNINERNRMDMNEQNRMNMQDEEFRFLPRNEEENEEYMKMIRRHPEAVRRIYTEVKKAFDRLDYNGSWIYDENPDRATLLRLSEDIYLSLLPITQDYNPSTDQSGNIEESNTVPGLLPNKNSSRWMLYVIFVLVQNELMQRRASR